MSTNSRIGIIRSDGSVDSIYCHWDGYYEHNGLILFNEYQNLSKLNSLIKLRSTSFLDENVEPCTDQNHSFKDPCNGVAIAYCRDRSERKCYINHARNISVFFKNSICFIEEYFYLYDENTCKWLTMSAYSKDMLVSLEEKLKELDLIEEPVYEMGGIK